MYKQDNQNHVNNTYTEKYFLVKGNLLEFEGFLMKHLEVLPRVIILIDKNFLDFLNKNFTFLKT